MAAIFRRFLGSIRRAGAVCLPLLLLAAEGRGVPPAGAPARKERTASQGADPPNKDEVVERLPEFTVSRLGSLRYRLASAIKDFAVSPDGGLIAIAGTGDFALLSARTGLKVRHPAVPPRGSSPVFSP